MNLKDIAVVDLFCGIGGLTHGFVKEGFTVVAGIDIDETCRYAFEKNNNSKFISKSITEITGGELNNLFGDSKLKILVGCAPCQPFSSLTFKNTKNNENEKWKLLYEFERLIIETKPEIVSMENVSQLINFKKEPIFEDFKNTLKKEGYKIHQEIINCPEYGIPQNRKRLVLLASKLGEINLIPKSHSKKNFVTVKDTIGKLPPIEDGEFHPKDKLHFARKLSPENKKRIKNTPYGGSWKDWPEELKLNCHKKDTGKSYSSVYGRMKWEEPSPTMTTHCIGYGNGRFGHPEQDRAISLREASLFQTFPKKYKFYQTGKEISSVTLARQIGNAVPVKLGEVIAKSIKEHLSI
ncbi:DNA cytosine methyltransferase [Flavobacterium oreochromis]|uniref:Cytosine-specific methyltransferase n=1 Tax=Flavobacterium oreochromis TaxID=2906078 RepID=A0ABW8PAB4_9FLAO|nr:DNA cytosine methyltransferase [Flavobacterium oreochromis]OWP76711.1 DNA (cytosine-5-)-methyltransferase [Flavobacterium oreochromis]